MATWREQIEQINKSLAKPRSVFTTRLEEVSNALKSAKWQATGGYELWQQYEGKGLTSKEQRLEQEARLEAYAKLRNEKSELESKVNSF